MNRRSMREEMAGFEDYNPYSNTMPTDDPFAALGLDSGTDDPFANTAQPGQPWTGEEQPFTFPGQEMFDALGAQLQDWMGGMVSEPGAFASALGYLDPLASMSSPVDVSGIYDAQKAVANRYLEEKGRDLAEQFGVGGLRWSTPLQSNIVRETERMGENMGLAAAQAQVSEDQMARNLALQAAMGMGNIGSAQGQFGLGAAGLQQNAANALFNLANTQAMMPLQIASGMMGLQQGMEGMQNQSMNQYQMNPFLPFALQIAGMNPTTFGFGGGGPSGFEQLMNIGGDWLQYFMNRGGDMPTTPVPPARDMSDIWNMMGGY